MRFTKIFFITLIALLLSVYWGSGLLLSIEGFRNFIDYVSDTVPPSLWIAVFLYGLWLIVRGTWGTVTKISIPSESNIEDVPPEWIQVIDNE